MSQPVDLIISNVAHETIEKIDSAQNAHGVLIEKFGTALTDVQVEKSKRELRCAAIEGFARAALCSIAHNASETTVRRALAVLGAPHEDDEIWGRLEAARNAQKREAEGAPAPPN